MNIALLHAAHIGAAVVCEQRCSRIHANACVMRQYMSRGSCYATREGEMKRAYFAASAVQYCVGVVLRARRMGDVRW